MQIFHRQKNKQTILNDRIFVKQSVVKRAHISFDVMELNVAFQFLTIFWLCCCCILIIIK